MESLPRIRIVCVIICLFVRVWRDDYDDADDDIVDSDAGIMCSVFSASLS